MVSDPCQEKWTGLNRINFTWWINYCMKNPNRCEWLQCRVCVSTCDNQGQVCSIFHGISVGFRSSTIPWSISLPIQWQIIGFLILRTFPTILGRRSIVSFSEGSRNHHYQNFLLFIPTFSHSHSFFLPTDRANWSIRPFNGRFHFSYFSYLHFLFPSLFKFLVIKCVTVLRLWNLWQLLPFQSLLCHYSFLYPISSTSFFTVDSKNVTSFFR